MFVPVNWVLHTGVFGLSGWFPGGEASLHPPSHLRVTCDPPVGRRMWCHVDWLGCSIRIGGAVMYCGV